MRKARSRYIPVDDSSWCFNPAHPFKDNKDDRFNVLLKFRTWNNEYGFYIAVDTVAFRDKTMLRKPILEMPIFIYQTRTSLFFDLITLKGVHNSKSARCFCPFFFFKEVRSNASKPQGCCFDAPIFYHQIPKLLKIDIRDGRTRPQNATDVALLYNEQSASLR